MIFCKENQIVKLKLPKGKSIDVLSNVIDKMAKYIQSTSDIPESGGFIVGYEHAKTGNITLEDISVPYYFDKKNRIRFEIRDIRHKIFLRRKMKKKSYYMGVWHTHPQKNPIPSIIDWEDWNESLKIDKTGSQYMFFIIAGIDEWKLWVGDCHTKQIWEAEEYRKNVSGIYEK